MTWLPGWERIEGNDAGTWAPGIRRAKLVLHTTEGTSVDGALAAYRAHNSWPHCTVDYRTKRRIQHVPLNRPARALANKAGGVQTGRAPIVLQVEIMGFAGKSHLWPPDEVEWLGSQVVGPMCRAGGVPITTAVTFYGENAGWTLASTTARQRLSGPAWISYEGVLGHQHVPENSHWDPGAIDIDRVLLAALNGSATPPEEDDMPFTEAELRAIVRDEVTKATADIRGQVVGAKGSDGKYRMDRLVKDVDDIGNDTDVIRAKVAPPKG